MLTAAIRVKLLCSVFIIALSGCANIPVKSASGNHVGQLMPLLAVPKAMLDHVWLEKFTFALNNKHAQLAKTFAKDSMLLQTELSEQGINLAAMSFSGALLAQASWQSGAQTVTSEIGLAKDFDAKQVLHDLQLANWPLTEIEDSLFTGFAVDESEIKAQQTRFNRIRRFYYQGEVIIIIRYLMPENEQQNQHIDFQQLSQGYQLSIERLSDDILTLNH